jgi:deoxyribonuclease-4
MPKSHLTIGAHKSASGGYDKAVERVADITGNCLQIFSYSPRSWQSRDLDNETKAAYLAALDEHDIGPVYFHACYLINLADRSQTGEKSVKNLSAELTLAADIGVAGSVVHTGTYKTDDGEPEDEAHYEHLLENIRAALKNSPDDALILLENAGNRKIGRHIQDLADIIADIDSDRLRICLDTCHLHAAGYDLSSEEKFTEFFNDFDEQIGLDKLELIHVNDSRDELGSLRDRHANIGEGNIPEKVFKLLVNRPETRDKPMIIETPGFGESGPDEKNLKILRGFQN